jgi:hypothetical protein
MVRARVRCVGRCENAKDIATIDAGMINAKAP